MNKKQIYIGLAVIAVIGIGLYLNKNKKSKLPTMPPIVPPTPPATKTASTEEKSNLWGRREDVGRVDKFDSRNGGKRLKVKCGDDATGHWHQYPPCPSTTK